MKLSQDAKLTKALVKKFDGPIQNITEAIDAYLEEHGFHIYPVKKEKVIESIDKFSLGDVVFVTDENHDQFGNYGDVIAIVSGAVKVDFGKGVTRIIPNDFLEFYEGVKEKGTVSVKEVEENPSVASLNDAAIDKMIKEGDFRFLKRESEVKPSAEEKFKIGTSVFKSNGRIGTVVANIPMAWCKVEFKDGTSELIKEGELSLSWIENEPQPSADGEENAYQFESPDKWIENQKTSDFREHVSFVPWQKCPVCEGEGEKEVVVRSSEGMGKYMKPCPCCDGSMVIPMKIERR